MKKILSLALALILALILIACNKIDTSSGSSELSGEFVKPDGYAAVLNVKINPEFNLYIDINGDVLALKAVNDDAASFSDQIDADKDTAESVLQQIIIKSNENGFLKNHTEVSVSVTETADDAFNTQELLVSAEVAINSAAASINITVVININTDPQSTQSETANSSNSSQIENNKPTNSSESTTSKQEQNSSQSTETHTHKFSDATCTSPKKCSCGATEGSALGHTWIPATCKAPKTCSVCNATEGRTTGIHRYKDDKCIVCGASNILNPKKSLKFGYDVEYVANEYFPYSRNDIYAPGFQFCNDGGYGDGEYYCIMIEAMFTNDPLFYIELSRTPIKYGGKDYYRCGAGQSPANLELTDSEIIITQDSMKIKAVLLANGKIRITESTEADYPVGMLFSTEWSMLS